MALAGCRTRLVTTQSRKTSSTLGWALLSCERVDTRDRVPNGGMRFLSLGDLALRGRHDQPAVTKR
jgi:hypothetical protein